VVIFDCKEFIVKNEGADKPVLWGEGSGQVFSSLVLFVKRFDFEFCFDR
jgi:hypothetical protein